MWHNIAVGPSLAREFHVPFLFFSFQVSQMPFLLREALGNTGDPAKEAVVARQTRRFVPRIGGTHQEPRVTSKAALSETLVNSTASIVVGRRPLVSSQWSSSGGMKSVLSDSLNKLRRGVSMIVRCRGNAVRTRSCCCYHLLPSSSINPLTDCLLLVVVIPAVVHRFSEKANKIMRH